MSLFEENFLLNKQAANEIDPDHEKELVERFKKGDLGAYRKLRRLTQGTVNQAISRWKPGDNTISRANFIAEIEGNFPKWVMNYNPEHEKGANFNTYLGSGPLRSLQNIAAEDQLGAYIVRDFHPAVNEYKRALADAQMQHNTDHPTDEQVLAMYTAKGRTMGDLQIGKSRFAQQRIGDIVTKNEEGEGIAFNHNDNSISAIQNEDDKWNQMKLEHIEDVMKRRLDDVQYMIAKEREFENRSLNEIGLKVGRSSTFVRSVLDKWQQIKKEEGISE